MATYVSQNAPKLKFRIEIDGADVFIQFNNKELHLDDEKDAAIIEALDILRAMKPHIAQLVDKVDIERARAIVAQHQSDVAEMRGTQKGAVSSADVARLMTKGALAKRDEDLRRGGASEADVASVRDKLAADNLILTEASKRVHRDTGAGFVADPVTPVAEVPEVSVATEDALTASIKPLAEIATPKTAFASLSKK